MCVWWSSRVLMNVIWKLWLFCALAIVCPSNPHVVGSSIRPSVHPSFFPSVTNVKIFIYNFPSRRQKKSQAEPPLSFKKDNYYDKQLFFRLSVETKIFFLTTKFSRVISIISAGMTRGVGNTEIVVEIAEINRQNVCVLKHAKLFLRFMENSWNSKDRRICVKKSF